MSPLAKKLMSDPETQRIAEALAMPLEQYVALVVHHHEKGPAAAASFFVVPDERLQEAGHPVPGERGIVAFFRERLRVDQLLNGSAFEPASRKRNF